MFRKRKDGNDQGYDRISRLVEERQRELAEGADEGDDLEEDTIIMHSATAPPAEDAEPEERPVSLFNVRGGAPRNPIGEIDTAGPAAANEAPQAAVSSADEEEDGRAEPASLDYEPEPEPDLAATLPLAPPAWQRAGDDESEAIRPDAGREAAVRERPAMVAPDLGRVGGGGTLVAANAVWEGKLRSDGDVRVEGVVQGEIDTAATLVIAEAARVMGTIHARNVLIGGEVEGDVLCEERLEVLPGGSARGQINSGTLVVHEGAYIDSRFQMRREASAG
ncbi:MAG TPA: polymer-forming cytoskeletal protein [Dehalococcoidia bacterium]|nr:polymer-forming cytoskeletal protein [Dehalococcoidia bacterium]